MKLSIKQKGYLYISLAMAMQALLGVFTAIGGKSIGAMQLWIFAFLIGTIISLLLVVFMKKTQHLKSILKDRKSTWILVAAGIMNYAGAYLLSTIGVLGTNPVVVSIVLKLWPIMLAIMLPFTIKTKVKLPQIAAMLIAFAGVYIMITNGSLVSINTSELPYIGLLIGSALFTAVSNLIIKGRNHDMISTVFLFNISSFLVLLAASPFFGATLTLSFGIPALVSILYLGFVSSVGALAFFYTLKAFDPMIAANASYTTPFMTMIFSYIMLGTAFQAYYMYALVPILGALFMQSHFSKTAPKFMTKKKSDVPFYDVTGAFVESTHPHIYAHIRGNGRVLAAKLKQDVYTGLEGKDHHNCLMFTNKEHPESIQEREMKFIEDLLAPQPDEVVLMAAGDVNNVEQALNEHL